MSYLPPVGWADVATKHDLDIVRRDLGELRTEVRDLRGESSAHVRTFMLATAVSVLTTASLAFAAARFA